MFDVTPPPAKEKSMPTKTAKRRTSKIAKKPAAKAKRVKWQDLTPRQQAAEKQKYKDRIAAARREIAAGGYTYEKTTSDGWDVFASNEDLVLHITADCVKNACRSSKKDCVIAKAIQRQQPFATGWQVGKNVCMIYDAAARKVIRYGTSGKLARALEIYDKTGQWVLQEGHYVLYPLPANYRVGTRWAWYKGSGGKASKYKGMGRAAPTRSGTYRGAIRQIP
jgi:hypothetical protein